VVVSAIDAVVLHHLRLQLELLTENKAS